MADAERITRWCRCDARLSSCASQTMRYSHSYGGWVLFDVPTRSMSQIASYYAFVERGTEYPHENHIGEPYVYRECPWCGYVLPGCEDKPLGQADGEEGG